jgi:hypothetical protein
MALTTFYSICPGLICYAGKTEMKNVNGTLQPVDPPMVRFTEFQNKVNGKSFGIFQTEDPDVIEYLNNRIKTSHDVIPGEEFARMMVPADVQVKTMEEQVRRLEEENRLLRAMKEQQAAAKGSK